MRRIVDHSLRIEPDGEYVISTYLTTKHNPQANIYGSFDYIKPDDFSFFQIWYTSVLYLDISAIIFHDSLSDEFTQRYATNRISFVKVQIGPYSLNDERFFIYAEFIELFQPSAILATDISDVFLKKNPFHLLNAANTVFFGSDVGERLVDNQWLMLKLSQLLDAGIPSRLITPKVLNSRPANAGIIMGRREPLSNLFGVMAKIISAAANEENHNMISLNIAKEIIEIEYYIGQPFSSRFKFFESWADVYIVHK